MQSGMAEFYRVLNSATELNLKQEDAAAKRAAAVRQANTAAQMRAVLARHEANQPAPPIPTPNTSLSSVGNVNDLPLEEGTMAQPGDMGGGSSEGPAPPGGPADLMPGGPGGGKKPPTMFGDTARPGMSDMAGQLRELGEVAIAGGDFKTGRQFLKDSAVAEKRAAEIDTEHLKQQADMADMLGSIAKSTHDQQSFTNALMIASMHGMAEEAAQLYQMTGGVYNEQAKAVLDQFAESSMSVKEQAQGQIATAKLANDNRRTESIIQARNVGIAKDRQSMGIARERLDLSKKDKKEKTTTTKTIKSYEFDRTMEAAGIKPGDPEYKKAARIKARLEKGAGGSSLTDEISKMLGEGGDQPSVLAPPGPDEVTPKPKVPAKEQTYGHSEGQIEATMLKFSKTREEVLAALKAQADKAKKGK